MDINQNFSVPAGSDISVTFTINPSVGFDLSGATVRWRAFVQAHGIPTAGVDAVIVKDNVNIDGGVLLLESPPSFVVDILAADTAGLLRNYYHEAEIMSADSLNSAVESGIMTVTQTEIR